MTTERELLMKLAIDQPWSWSTEGLDDCCLFCGSDDTTYSSARSEHRYIHRTDCVWFEAREYLGLTQKEHVRAEASDDKPDRPADDGSQAAVDQTDKT